MSKKHILKPGKHQFVPGSAPVHDNNNLSDEEAEWYLQRYPHIAGLFETNPEERKSESPEEIVREPEIEKQQSANDHENDSVQS